MQLNGKTMRIAIPSKGRLQEPAETLLKAAGVSFRRTERTLMARAKNFDLVVLFVRPDDIPILVAEGAADLGMVGIDLVEERACLRRVRRLLDLDFGHCRLAVAAKTSSKIRKVRELRGHKVAASMVHTARSYFRKQKVEVQIVEVSGSVEIMVELGLADAIVDLVETGDTLRDNGLELLDTISRSQAVLIGSRQPRNPELCGLLARRLEGVITARQYTLLEYNIRRSRLKEAESIAPGFESPTVSALEDSQWCAVKVMVPRNRSLEIIDKLESLGATAILETTIHNCRL